MRGGWHHNFQKINDSQRKDPITPQRILRLHFQDITLSSHRSLWQIDDFADFFSFVSFVHPQVYSPINEMRVRRYFFLFTETRKSLVGQNQKPSMVFGTAVTLFDCFTQNWDASFRRCKERSDSCLSMQYFLSYLQMIPLFVLDCWVGDVNVRY